MTEHNPPLRPTPPSFFERANTLVKESVTIKLIVIGFLTLIMLIPIGMVESLIHERTYRQNDAKHEIGKSWAQSQSIGGPVINIPYHDHYIDSDTKSRGTMHLLPDDFSVSAVINPEIRYRGIFEIPVYQSVSEVSFYFNPEHLKEYSDRKYDWDKMTLSFGVSDPRGITEETMIEINGSKTEFQPGLPDHDVFDAGIYIPLTTNWTDSTKSIITGSTTLNLRGTGSMFFEPAGKSTNIDVKSSWANPSFVGSFLPNSREVTKDGFDADWSVLQYNRSVPQVFSGRNLLSSYQFGVDLFTPVNHYQKSERSIKYAVMLIALTFILFFFSQAINKIRIHPFQYFLVGLALCLFYTLLLSLSEHLGFNVAYGIAASMILTMISLYIRQVFGSLKFTLITSGVLAGLYIYIYTLLQMQDYALLIGSLGLFIILGLIMWLSLKIQWGGASTSKTEIDQPS